MNEPLPSRPDASDDWLDDVLRADGREHRADYLDDDGFTARVMSALPAAAQLPAWRKPALAAGLRSCWSTPIRAPDGRMLGTVAMYFRQPRSPLKRDFELMARLTALASIAIERKRAEEALRRSESR